MAKSSCVLEKLHTSFAFRFDFIEMFVQRFFEIPCKTFGIFNFLVQINRIHLDMIGNPVTACTGIINFLEYVRVVGFRIICRVTRNIVIRFVTRAYPIFCCRMRHKEEIFLDILEASLATFGEILRLWAIKNCLCPLRHNSVGSFIAPAPNLIKKRLAILFCSDARIRSRIDFF